MGDRKFVGSPDDPNGDLDMPENPMFMMRCTQAHIGMLKTMVTDNIPPVVPFEALMTLSDSFSAPFATYGANFADRDLSSGPHAWVFNGKHDDDEFHDAADDHDDFHDAAGDGFVEHTAQGQQD